MNIAMDVKAGAAILDTYIEEDWRSRIDLDTLDIKSPYHCVLAQVYGHYAKSPEAICFMPAFLPGPWLGSELNEAWRKYLTPPPVAECDPIAA